MWKIVLIAILVLGLCVLGLCINIIFKKNGKFPDGEIAHNKGLRKQGIVCMREQDEKIWGKSSHIRITKEKRIKHAPDENCAVCTEICELRGIISK